ncbi:MAG TPA: MlaD family protein [Longimicrobiales bacterium]|nr:MlaD family protein [Longimicrobiales bacterium]
MARGKLSRGDQWSRQIRVGIVLVLGLVILGYAIFQVGRLFDVFASRYELVTLVESSGGLIEGAPVTLAGQRIGQVAEIRFIPVERRAVGANLFIRLSINQNVQEQIRADSEASLRTQGVLGDRFVDISPGSPGLPVLEAGDTLPSHPPLDYEEVLQTAARTLTEVQGVVDDLHVMTGRMASGEGTIGALLADDRLYERMTVATGQLAGLLNAVNASDGTLGRMIRDPELYNRMNAALTRLDSLGLAILAGEGSLGRLIGDDALYEGMLGVVGRADSAVLGVQGLLSGIETGDGTMARLLEDPALYDEFLKTVVDLQNLIRAIRDDPRRFRPEVNVEVF